MNAHLTRRAAPPPANTAINWRQMVRFVVVATIVPGLLFVTAGRIDWWQGWVYAGLTIGLSFASRYILFLKHPELIAERARFTQSAGTNSWDKRLVVWLAIVGPLVFVITAGLDKRLGWSAALSLPVQLGALAVFVLGYGLATWALIVNKFFSSVVRIQTERGHTVVTTGPYRLVRHPGYCGGIVSWLASPLVLGSLWSFIPAVIVVALTIVRTALEDRTLHAELPGYREYAARVRYRLLPGVW